MVLSESASYEDAVSKYAWMQFTGSRGREVTQRSHKRMIRNGDTFGILPLRNGGRYTLIFPDMPHVDFPLDKTTGLLLIERSSKLRKPPAVVKREAGTTARVAGAKSLERKINRTLFDAPRFMPKSVKSEAVYGVDFANYQWRMVPGTEYPVKTTKGIYKMYRNDMIGVRFLRQGKGGIVINTEGLFLKVDDAQYDLIVHDTNILPLNDWPVGSVDVDTIKQYRRMVRRARHREGREQEEAERLGREASALERKQQRKELAQEARKKARERSAEMRDLRRKVRDGEIEAPTGPQRTIYSDDPGLNDRRRLPKVIEHENLDDAIEEHLDLEQDLDEQRLEDILQRSPFAGDVFSLEDTVSSMFGGDDSADNEVDSELDLSDIDEPDDDEEEVAPKSKVRKKGGSVKNSTKDDEPDDSEEANLDDDSELEEDDPEGGDVDPDDETEEDDPDAEEDADDSDSESDDEDGDDSSDDSDDDSDVESDDADDGGDDEEDTSGDDDEEDDDSADDTSDAVDETEADEDQDSDVAEAEKEAAETAKKIAATNKSTPDARADEAEEGDVLRFKADAKLQRDWVVLKVSTHNSSDNIVVYTLYDITNSPDEVRQVRVNRARKQNLFDYAEHVKDMAPKLFNRVYDMAEDYEVNKDPIAS
ncbi:hypothetical protein pEaSNUABM25_00156 [Erwinia phage pEa_SNUABM_25]|nr:hypothetical protein pEaSNUABM25_00156 [Erwinia phage pEa_SNUABM_25]